MKKKKNNIGKEGLINMKNEKITIEEIAKNMEGMRGYRVNLEEDIREKFEDYDYEGETQVLFSLENNLCYVNHKYSPQIIYDLETYPSGEYLITKTMIIH